MTQESPDLGRYPIFVAALDLITPEHIEALLVNRVRESRYLDYKRELYPATDQGNVSVLRHVCAFANQGGGLIVFGVDESNEEPIAVRGVDVTHDDIRRIRRLIHEGIVPTLRGVDAKIVAHHAGNVLLLRVPRGGQIPHMVDYRNHHRFYTRFGSDTVPMTVHEIRESFVSSGLESFSDGVMSPATSPLNIEFLQAVYNSMVEGDVAAAKATVIKYIGGCNAELGTRSSDMSALYLDHAGRLRTTGNLQRHALALAKSNTYFRALTRDLDRIVDHLQLLRKFLLESDHRAGVEQMTTLLRDGHEADLKFEGLVSALRGLVEALSEKTC